MQEKEEDEEKKEEKERKKEVEEKKKKRDNRCSSKNLTQHIRASVGRNIQFMNLEAGDVRS